MTDNQQTALLKAMAEALRLAANGLRHCSRWNISEEKSQALLTHVGTIETLLERYDAQVRASGAQVSRDHAGNEFVDVPQNPSCGNVAGLAQANIPAWAWRQAINRYGINAAEVEQRAAELSSKAD